MADPRQSLDSEQISLAAIAHHTVYEKTGNLQQNHVCRWEAQLYLVGPLSRLVDKPPFEPSLSKYNLPLTTVAYGPNSAISLTQTFNRVLFDVAVEISGRGGGGVFSSHSFWTSSSLDVAAGVTQEEGHTGVFIHLPTAVRALMFLARRIKSFLSLVDREVDFCVLTI